MIPLLFYKEFARENAVPAAAFLTFFAQPRILNDRKQERETALYG